MNPDVLAIIRCLSPSEEQDVYRLHDMLTPAGQALLAEVIQLVYDLGWDNCEQDAEKAA
jgi:hypothetical protein